MKYLLIAIFLFQSFQMDSQIEERRFMKMTPEEIQLETYKKDPEAGAVVLYDSGKSIFFDTPTGYDIRFTRHKRIKILKKTGFEHGEISIPFYVDKNANKEKVVSIKATTLNYKNGSLISTTELDPTTIYEEKINNRWKNKKFVFPNMQEGSILEFMYVLETPFHFNLPNWTFQNKIPTIYSSYEVNMIPFYEYEMLAQGISRFDHQSSIVSKVDRTWGSVIESRAGNVGGGIEFQDMIHTYVLKDLPAFKDESFISSMNDYVIKMDFQLAKVIRPRGGSDEIISTWPKLNESLIKNKHFGKYQKKCKKYAKKVLEKDLDVLGLSDLEKSKKIIEYVKSNFTWNKYQSKYSSQSAKDFYKSKTGNSADINLFLLALLQQANIDCSPLILSTRGHGKIKSRYPFDHFTNYVVAYVQLESSFLADATEEKLPYNRVPTRCFNEKGVVVNKEERADWLQIQHLNTSIRINNISLKINEEASHVINTLSLKCTDYDAFDLRKHYKDDTTQIKEAYKDNIGNIKKVKTSGYNTIDKPYTIILQGEKKIEKLGDNLIINPFLNLAITKNPLTQKKRTYPVDFVYPKNKIFDITIIIPSGYLVSHLPEAYSLDNDLAEIKLNYDIKGNLLKISGNYDFKKSIYKPIEYARIKTYTDTIVKIFNEEILLEKTE